MTTNELLRANKLSTELIAKLEKIKALWAEIPNADDLAEIGKEAAEIAANLKNARDAYCHKDFPGIDDLTEIGQKAAAVAVNLNEAKDAYCDKDFPGACDFEDLDTKLGSIAGSLNEIIEKQAELTE